MTIKLLNECLSIDLGLEFEKMSKNKDIIIERIKKFKFLYVYKNIGYKIIVKFKF